MSTPPEQLKQETISPFSIDVLSGIEQAVFDDACMLLAHVSGAPFVQISFYDGQLFKKQASYGMNGYELPNACAFLQDTLNATTRIEIADCDKDQNYADDPLVVGSPKFCYYYGLPIIHQGRQRIGAVSIASSSPLTLNDEQRQAIMGMRDQCQYIVHMRHEQIENLKALGEQLEVQMQLAFEKKLSEKTSSKLLSLNKKLEETNQQLEKANEQLRLLSTTDQMTQCLNRHALFEILATELKRASRDKLPLSLLMLDVDYFKPYNDHYGHILGDQCLTRVAKTLKTVLHRPSDIIARYGGEEFIYLLPNTNHYGAEIIGKQALQTISDLKIPHDYSQCSPVVTISLGIKTLDPGDDSLDISQIIDLADAALYEAKSAGRNNYVISSGS